MTGQRSLAIDRFRGMTIIVMVVVNDLAGVQGIPWILKHAPKEAGITVADLVSKFFLFAIAATYAMSFNKRLARDDKKDAYFHFVSRYFAMMGIGCLFGVFNAAWTGDTMWGTLQTIGLAGLLTLLLIGLPWWVRALSGLLVLMGWQCLYRFANGLFTGEMGALLESLTSAAALMLSTAMIDMFNRGRKAFLIASGVLSLAALGPLLLPGMYITKENQITYILICVAIACWAYLAFDLLSKKIRPHQPGLLCWWGENPMLLYIFHLMLTGAVMGLERPLWLAIPIDLAILASLNLIAWGMHRKAFRVSF